MPDPPAPDRCGRCQGRGTDLTAKGGRCPVCGGDGLAPTPSEPEVPRKLAGFVARQERRTDAAVA